MVTLTYAVESWAQYWPDAEKLWPVHWQEIALDHERIPLDVDVERYAALDGAGQLHIVTAREEQGTLQGYHLSIVSGHLHYKSTLHAFLDVFWLAPACRQGWAGYKLFTTARDTLKARGCVKMLQGHKLHVHGELGVLFARLGGARIEHVYSLML